MRLRTALLATLMSGASAPPLHAADDIRSVTLSSGGLAEVTRAMPVEGDATLSIEVPSTQVDDILKSLVVGDPAGTVSSMTLDGMEQAEETFRAMPFTAADLRALPTLLGALQGTEVSVTSGGKTIKGKVLGVSPRSAGHEGGSLDILTVISAAGSVDVLPLGTDASVAILDPAMLAKVTRAALAAGRERAEGAKLVEIRVRGSGHREIAVSYVVAAPIWKAAYRVVSRSDGKAQLQAWAVIENATGEDWKGVAVTLASGAPVTLTQRLYQRYWRKRPEMPVDNAPNIVPQADNEGESRPALRVFAPAPAPMPSMAFEAAPKMSAPAETGLARESDVTATYALPSPVDLNAGHTLSVPIVDAVVDAARISVFQPENGSTHPAAALMIANATGASLPPGILTVYDEATGYVGDARLLGIPPGEERMAAFATDTKVEVIAETKPEEDIAEVKVADGIANISYRTRSTTTYEIHGAEDGKRSVVIEHPRRDGWTFASDALRGSTATTRRLVAELAPKETKTVTAVDEMIRLEGVSLGDASDEMLTRWSTAGTDPATASKFLALSVARSKAAEAERKLEEIDATASRIEHEQNRIRSNLAAVPSQSEDASAYLKDLRVQEGMLNGLWQTRAAAEDELRQSRDSLGAIIRSF